MIKREIVLERTYPYPIQQVWEALTDSKAMTSWLMESDFQPQVGHKFQFHTKSRPGFNGTINCEVLEVDEPHRLAYSWWGEGGAMVRPTVVTWTLHPLEQGTHLRLEHAGFEGERGLVISLLLGAGWKKILGKSLLGWLERLVVSSR